MAVKVYKRGPYKKRANDSRCLPRRIIIRKDGAKSWTRR
jgi:hypothetical protein